MEQLPIIEPPANSSLQDAEISPEFSRGSYAFVSLGCPKNLVDSEKMLGTLALDGYTLVSEPEGADFV
ncbi:MAG: 30S ribosomal protein S12 methylthiotransferase RimO, partial [Planctomycetaceae bacterium]|nr:30S ribosomal protein S12 methylthiotransferase RimO [Planctomycetaceae bacterium]